MRVQPVARVLPPDETAPQLHCRWSSSDAKRSLARRVIQAIDLQGVDGAPAFTDGGVPLTGGSQAGSFDVVECLRQLCTDVAARCPELYHVDMDRILLGVTQARHPRRCGLLARITPLRFRGGGLYRRRGGRLFQVQRYWHNGVEMLYVMTFCLPRFLDQSFDEKFVTIFHELYHVAPEFNGDLRRHEGRYGVHTRDKRAYDRHMASLARDYLASGADPSLHQFLRFNFRQLQALHGQIVGQFVPLPKIVPVDLVSRRWQLTDTNAPAFDD